MNKFIISCDWGTSEFRLRIINIIEALVVKEIVSPNGVLSIQNQWAADSKKISIKEFYLQFLLAQIKLLLVDNSENFENSPLLISGMASSSIGIEELPYAKIPFALIRFSLNNS